MRAHDCEARVDDAAFALLNLVHGRLNVVVDANSRYSTQRRERADMRVEQHLVALAGVRYTPEHGLRTASCAIPVRAGRCRR